MVLTDNVHMQSIEVDPTVWADKIMDINMSRNNENIDILVDKGYDIRLEANKLMEKYLSLYPK